MKRFLLLNFSAMVLFLVSTAVIPFDLPAGLHKTSNETSEGVSQIALNRDLAATCDQLAADSVDYDRTAKPVPDTKFNFGEASKACLQAVDAEPENPRFWFQLGKSFLLGDKGDKSLVYFGEAAKRNYPAAHFYLGMIEEFGLIKKPRFELALNHYASAARLKHPLALIRLGNYQLKRKSSPEKAFEHYIQAAENGEPSAYYLAGGIFYSKSKNKDALRKGIKIFQRGSKNGCVQCDFALGIEHLIGRILDRSHSKALELLNRSAANGGADAQYALAKFYVDGHETPINLDKAKEYVCMDEKNRSRLIRQLRKFHGTTIACE